MEIDGKNASFCFAGYGFAKQSGRARPKAEFARG